MSPDVKAVVLGAGRPLRGFLPAALKPISLRQRALDWQISSFQGCDGLNEIVFIGGYEFESVVRLYPQLRFIMAPDWREKGVIHTMFQAPKGAARTLFTYSDTVFSRKGISLLLAIDADAVFGYDSGWRERYAGRTKEDIVAAETIRVQTEYGVVDAEFTGLLVLGASALDRISYLGEAQAGASLPELITQLERTGLSVVGVDLCGQWAEFNAPSDIARFILGSKADTLARLASQVTQSRIGEQVSFTIAEWQTRREEVIGHVREVFGTKTIIVRSSSASEDGWSTSSAGRFESVACVHADDPIQVVEAVERVAASFAAVSSPDDQVLVQEQLLDVRMAGVALTCGLDTGAPYYCLNVDQESGSTNVVTAGGASPTRTLIISRSEPGRLAEIDPALMPVLDAVREMETILAYERLDIEFAVDAEGMVHIFQVRPITVDHSEFELDPDFHRIRRKADADRFRSAQARSPWIVGRRTIFGDMPDWNPAEILGARPRPLALSLYQHIITDDIWASQRAGFGYRDVRPHPLLTVFSGRPFVDVRASLNSFVPACLDEALAERLVEAGIERLASRPQLHDKIEFDVIFTIWDPSFRKKAEDRFTDTPVTASDVDMLEEALKAVTRRALLRLDDDIAPLQALMPRRQAILTSDLSPLNQVHALIEDCKQFGAPVFAHAARAGFVAVSLLDGLTATGGLLPERRQAFLRSLDTVARKLRSDRAKGMPLEQLVAKYGHLRPGTYDMTAEAYHEDPAFYLCGPVADDPAEPFVATPAERRAIEAMLAALGSDVSIDGLLAYLKGACEAREATKFEFTRNVSLALDRIAEAVAAVGIDRDAASYLRYADVMALRSGVIGVQSLENTIRMGRAEHRHALVAELPSLIVDEADFTGFERRRTSPNFITLDRVHGIVHPVHRGTPPPNTIILTPQADPGYDWLFDYRIAGLVTRYGGANSHMAIRAAELGLPAAIGVGEAAYERIAAMRAIELDCANRTIRELP